MPQHPARHHTQQMTPRVRPSTSDTTLAQRGRTLVRLLSTAIRTRTKKTARRIITHSESVGIWFTGGIEGGAGGTGLGVVDAVTAVKVALPGMKLITKAPRVVL